MTDTVNKNIDDSMINKSRMFIFFSINLWKDFF